MTLQTGVAREAAAGCAARQPGFPALADRSPAAIHSAV